MNCPLIGRELTCYDSSHLAYLQELKARNIQHARNLYDRAVTLLPRVDQMWLKFVYLEELLQNIAGARQVFERWMKWEPDDKGQSNRPTVLDSSPRVSGLWPIALGSRC